MFSHSTRPLDLLYLLRQLVVLFTYKFSFLSRRLVAFAHSGSGLRTRSNTATNITTAAPSPGSRKVSWSSHSFSSTLRRVLSTHASPLSFCIHTGLNCRDGYENRVERRAELSDSSILEAGWFLAHVRYVASKAGVVLGKYLATRFTSIFNRHPSIHDGATLFLLLQLLLPHGGWYRYGRHLWEIFPGLSHAAGNNASELLLSSAPLHTLSPQPLHISQAILEHVFLLFNRKRVPPPQAPKAPVSDATRQLTTKFPSIFSDFFVPGPPNFDGRLSVVKKKKRASPLCRPRDL